MIRQMKSMAVAAFFAAWVGVSPVFAGGVDCPGDIDGNGSVEFADLLDVLTAWGPCPPPSVACPEDLDGDEMVGFADLLVVITNWGPCPVEGKATETELAGNSLSEYPFFEYVRALNVDASVEVAIDPTRFPISGDCDIYIVAAKTAAQWAGDPSLTDVTGGAQTETFGGATIQANTFTVSGGEGLSTDAGDGLGVPYDVVLDCNQNGVLDGGDYIDGLSAEEGGTPVHGMYKVHDTTQPGPHAVTELSSYSVGTVFGIVPTRTMQNTF